MSDSGNSNSNSKTEPVLTVSPNGTQQWRLGKFLHREDGPALINPNGDSFWFIEGALHREGGPALEIKNITKGWFRHGKLHREDGPANITTSEQSWCYEGKLHRADGPAVEMNDGRKEWWVDGKRHRADGPAVTAPDAEDEWWVDGQRLAPEVESMKRLEKRQEKGKEVVTAFGNSATKVSLPPLRTAKFKKQHGP